MVRTEHRVVAVIGGLLFALLPCRSGPASATESDQCYEAAKQYGAMMAASIFCNFPERPALTKQMNILPQVCQAASGDELKELVRPGVEEGSKIFHGDLEKYGQQKACSEWDQFIRTR